MLKSHIAVVILLIACLNVFSQQDKVNFKEKTIDDVKVESLKGFELRLIPFPYGLFSSRLGYPYTKPFSFSAYVGYFNEKRMASSWTFLSTIGFHNVAIESPVMRLVHNQSHGFYMSVGPDTRLKYSLLLEAGVEPRWYPGFKNRFLRGKAQLNSGWYLSSPLLFRTVLLHSPEPLIHMGWFPSIAYTGTFSFVPTVGYRQAISRRWFVEGNVGFGPSVMVGTNTIDHRFTVEDPELSPAVKLKAAYTLK